MKAECEVVVETKAVCNLTVSYRANQAMYDSRVRGGGVNKGCVQSDCQLPGKPSDV